MRRGTRVPRDRLRQRDCNVMQGCCFRKAVPTVPFQRLPLWQADKPKSRVTRIGRVGYRGGAAAPGEPGQVAAAVLLIAAIRAIAACSAAGSMGLLT